MNEGFKKFMNDIGILVEMWIVVYGQFVAHGQDSATALKNTESFMRATLGAAINSQPNGEGEK